ncbi:hypothetical protein FOL47_009685 [Perkinsus chesapeaki]|uniref:Aluminum-activated malate transporter 1 n=1 Tax=Perkinsus chesapeaki TaxID=330153 RepID=A0A7J6L6X7_PERCH|nr:hypothetical protein FOL47_009685 [Perkinsus chesapeaki]
MYPRPGWSLSLYDLVDIFYGVVAAIVLTIPAVAPPADAFYVPIIVMVAPSIAPMVPMQPLPMALLSIILLFAFALGFSLGFIVYALGEVASGGTPLDRAWACFALLPFTLLLALGLPQARTKFSGFLLAGITMGIMYIPVGFYSPDPYTEVSIIFLLLICLLAISTGLAIVWKLLHFIPYKGPEPLQVFAYTYADCFDTLVGYFDSASEHPEVVEAVFQQFDAACMAVAPCKKVSPALGEVMWNLAGELFALYDCLNQHQFDSVTQKMLWEPLASEVFDIRGAVGKTLRKTADGEPTEADIDILRKVRTLQKHAGEVSVALRDCQAIVGEDLNQSEVARFYYALESILSIAALVERYRILYEEADEAAKEKAEENKTVADRVAPLLLGGCLEEYEGDDERLAALMNKWEDFGREAYNQIALRINLMDHAAAEIAIYGRLHLVPELSKRVWRKQRDITSIQRSGLVLFTSVLILYPHVNDPKIRDLFRPANDRIRALGKAVQASANRMTELLKTGVVTNSPGVSEANDDLHVEVQRCIDAMRDQTDRITAEFITNPNRSGDPSAYMKLFHTAYALSNFATTWEQLENVLMGERVPCEMAQSPPNSTESSSSQTVPTFRGREQS